MTRKDRTEGIFSRREVLDATERQKYYQIQLKELLSYAYRYSEDVKKRFDRAQFSVEKFRDLIDLKHVPILKKKELGELGQDLSREEHTIITGLDENQVLGSIFSDEVGVHGLILEGMVGKTHFANSMPC